MRPQWCRVLFLCTGNYYRSRFAEVLFNRRAQEAGLPWRADSRGLALERGIPHNVGPISPHVLDALRQRGIPVGDESRPPLSVTLADLAGSDLVIAVKEAEHRPLMEERFPSWADRIEYWHVHDMDGFTVGEALREIEHGVAALVERLHAAVTERKDRPEPATEATQPWPDPVSWPPAAVSE